MHSRTLLLSACVGVSVRVRGCGCVHGVSVGKWVWVHWHGCIGVFERQCVHDSGRRSAPHCKTVPTLPAASSRATLTPRKGLVAEPGLVGVAPGNGVSSTPPLRKAQRTARFRSACARERARQVRRRLPPHLSVCQKVSTMAHLPAPTTLWNHRHASGFMGSPAVPACETAQRGTSRGVPCSHSPTRSSLNHRCPFRSPRLLGTGFASQGQRPQDTYRECAGRTDRASALAHLRTASAPGWQWGRCTAA